MKTKKCIRLHGLSQKRIRRKKENKRIQIKNKNKNRKKIYFKKRKLIHNDNNSEAKTNYSENIDEVFTVSKEYYNKIEKIIDKLTTKFNIYNDNYNDKKDKEELFTNKINDIINRKNKNKINIILDIDQTLVFSQLLTSYEDINYINDLNIDKTDSHFITFLIDNNQYFYYIQVRPYLKQFISKLSPYCNFYINSMANPNYVRTVLILLNQKYNLILNDDGLNNVFITPPNEQKTLPNEITKDGNFIILDDNIYAWDKSYLNNIIPVKKFFGFYNYYKKENIYANDSFYIYYLFTNKIYCFNEYNKGHYDKNNRLQYCSEASWSEINQLNNISDIIIKIYILSELFKIPICFSFYNIINNILNECYIFYEGEDEEFFNELINLLGGNYTKDFNKATHILVNENKAIDKKKFDNNIKYNYINIKWLFDSFFYFIKCDEKNYKLITI
jgi:hypothetical protein